ncbi:MAG: hypothetical protein ACYTGB_17455 [Planctomycetota bacterium]|jgi:hypothetical protein
MRRISGSGALLAVVALVLGAGGCGNDSSSRNRNKEPDPVKVIGEMKVQAAMNGMRRYARDQAVAAETVYGKECGPLKDAEERVTSIKKAMAQPGSEREMLAKDLEAAEKQLARERARLGKKSESLGKTWGRWRVLNDQLKGPAGKYVYEIVDHTVDPEDVRVKGQRTSTLVLKPKSFKEVLGEGNLTFKLTWHRVERVITGVGARKESKINWELRQCKLVSGGLKKSE